MPSRLVLLSDTPERAVPRIALGFVLFLAVVQFAVVESVKQWEHGSKFLKGPRKGDSFLDLPDLRNFPREFCVRRSPAVPRPGTYRPTAD